MSAMPVFSYAQAAKGAKAQAPPKPAEPPAKVEPLDLSAGARPSTKSDPPSSAPSRASRSRPRTEDKENQASANIASAATPPAATPPEPSTEKETTQAARRASSRAEPAQPVLSGPTSPKPASETGSPKEKDLLRKTDRRDSWEKGSQSSNTQDKAITGDRDKDKTKDSEDDWEKVSVPSIAADKELKAAPLPAVNVWAARLEALAAKKKELAAKAPVNGTHAPAEATSKPHVDEAKRKAASRDTSDKDLSASFPKPDASAKANANTDFPPAQSSRPASQHGEKPAAAAAARPPVDTTSWPTPENATADDRRKPHTQDKADKPDTPKSATTKSHHGNKWITVPFVPTAKFETPLPALATKRGSRTGRGRDNQARGGAQSSTTADRAEPGSMGPPPVPNKAQDQDRGRKPDAARGGRSSSLPASNRRPTSRENVLATLRKPAAPLKDESTLESPARSNLTGSEHVNGAAVSDSKNQSRSSSRHKNGHGAGSGSTAEAVPSHNAAQNGTEPYSATAIDPPARFASGQERAKPSQPHYRTSADPSRDRGSHRNRDWSREKSDAAREKVESWRDRDFSGESAGRRERSDRGRGGYRGRGAHSYNSHQPHQSHPYTAPLPQNGFDSAKPHHAEPRSRQSSQPFVPPNSSSSNRPNPRSHSIPVGMMYSNFYGIPAMQHIVPQLQTDIPPYAYPSPVPVDQGIMSAMPYNNSLNSYAVMSMVITQFEYYFSIDNLCKDMYLRKNMDSQGWVPLRVVANFKRIKALTEENFPWDMMRFVASQVRNVEHLAMPDGEDKLRSRENWRDFVLPIDDRFPAAQTDGPHLPYSHQPPQQFAPVNQEILPAISSPIRSPNATVAIPNGSFEAAPLPTYGPISPLDGPVVDRGFGLPLSPTTQGSPPPQPPRESPGAQKSHYPRVFRDRPTGQIVSPTANGHRHQPSRNFNEEVTFPDEGIAGIRILMREPSSETARDDVATSPQLSHVLTNESRASTADATASAPLQRAPAQRGLTGLPEHSGPGLQGVVFGYSNPLPTTPDTARFVNKDGLQSEIPADKPGQYSLSYPEAHESAFRNRALGIPDAMATMYSFWSSFLVDNFNLGMYQDFKNTCLQDLSDGDDSGIKHLMLYFDKALKSQVPIADVVATDLAHFLRDEADGKARVYKIIRMAWRNGALNLKTRKRIGDLLSDEEKASFDKGG